MSIDTQASAGMLAGSMDESGVLVIGGEVFMKPTTADDHECVWMRERLFPVRHGVFVDMQRNYFAL